MIRKIMMAAGILALAAEPAAAQAVIIGGGLAKDCYMAVEAQSSRHTEVERLCSQALETETMTRTNRAATYVNRGIVRMRSGDYPNALEDYDRAIALEAELGAAYLNRGAALILSGDHAAALETLNKAIELNTNDLHAALYNRAIAKEKTGDVSGAYYDFLEASRLQPEWDLPQRQLTRFTITRS